MTVLNTPYKAEVYRVRPKDFASQVEVAACYIRHGNRYLLLHRAAGKPQEHTWGVPAGKLESGESSRAAVVREVEEETGIRLDDRLLKEIGTLYVRYPHIDFIYHMFSQEVVEAPQLRLSDEHQDYRWVELEEIFNLPLISGAREALYQFLALERLVRLPRRSFYFVRHGETDANANPHIKRVDYDLPLNQRGRQQAVDAKEVAQNLSFRKVKCSPTQRAQQTKELMLDGFDVEYHDDDRLSECCTEVWSKMVQLEESYGYKVCPSVQGFLSRVIDGVASALEEEDSVFILAHGGVHWAICYHMCIEDHPWKIGNCEIVHFEPVGDTHWKARVLS